MYVGSYLHIRHVATGQGENRPWYHFDTMNFNEFLAYNQVSVKWSNKPIAEPCIRRYFKS